MSWGNVCPRAISRRVANSRIEEIPWIKAAVVFNKCWLCPIEVADIMFGRIFGAPLVQDLEQTALDVVLICALPHEIVLMEDVAEEMPVIDSVDKYAA